MKTKAHIQTPRKHKAKFAARLRIVRELAGYDQAAPFSRSLNMEEPETYRRWERGETEPDISMLTKIHEVTGADLNYLIAGDMPGHMLSNVYPLPPETR